MFCKNYKNHLFFLLVIFPVSLIGQKTETKIAGEYEGSWAMSFWFYAFKKDNTYQFETHGHFGNSTTIGEYNISGDTLYLKPFTIEKQKNKSFIPSRDTLLLDGDSCIVNISLGYDYCKKKKTDNFIHNSRKRFNNKLEESLEK